MEKNPEDYTLKESWEEFRRTVLEKSNPAPGTLELIRAAFYAGADAVWLMADGRSPAATVLKLREIYDWIQEDFLKGEEWRRNLN